jgi:hypothetical protein
MNLFDLISVDVRLRRCDIILVDFNGLVVGMVAQYCEEFEEDVIRHIVLNQLRMYSHRFKKDYGEMVICCEGRSWRKEYFEYYKAGRAKKREGTGRNWKEAFRILNMILDEIRENVPYKVLQHERAEADDIIGVIAEYTQQFGRHDDVLILSGDHDFKQLLKYSNVRQFSPMQKKFVECKDPAGYLIEHIIKGDKGDEVPNILSRDDVFVSDERQVVMTAKRFEACLTERTVDQERNYQRNETLVDLSKCPQDIKDDIIDSFETVIPAPRGKLMNYLVKKRCKQLIDSIGEF